MTSIGTLSAIHQSNAFSLQGIAPALWTSKISLHILRNLGTVGEGGIPENTPDDPAPGGEDSIPVGNLAVPEVEAITGGSVTEDSIEGRIKKVTDAEGARTTEGNSEDLVRGNDV